MRRTSRITAACAVVAALTLAACTGGGTNVVRPQAGPAGVKVQEATFVYVSHLEIVTDWDPATSYSNEVQALQNIYETLTLYNPLTKKAAPRLAVSWQSSSDARTWTFRLRPNARFHTGRPVDAAAVKESIERTRALEGGPAYIWESVQSIQIVDPLTVRFHLKYPVALDLVASSTYAAYVYDTKAAGDGDLKKWFAAGRDAGSGPYTVARWNKGKAEELVLKAFDDYWGGWEGPRYRNVVFRVEPDLNAAWRRLLNGEVSFVSRLNPRLYRQAETTPGVRSLQVPSFQNLLVLFNTSYGPLRDIRLRKALQKAIDYDGVIRALRGAGEPATGLVPEGLVGHTPERRPRQDLEGAAQLLAEAGYGPGLRPLRLTLTYAEGDNDEAVLVNRLTETLRELNVTLDARAMKWTEQWARGKAKDPARRQDIFVMYWWPDYADAYSWYLNVFHSQDPPSFNLTYLNDKKTDEKIEALPTLLATNRPAAERAYAELQNRLIDRLAVVAVPWVVNYQRAYLGGVQGYNDNPAYPNVVFVHDLEPRG